MVSTCSLISKSYGPFTKPLGIVPSAHTTIGMTVTFNFSCFFFSSLTTSLYYFLFSLSFIFTRWSTGTAKSTHRLVLFFLWLSLGLVFWPRSVYISKALQILCVSLSRTDFGLCIDHSFVWSSLMFWPNSQYITFPNQPCLVLYYFCANLLHSSIIWLIVCYYFTLFRVFNPCFQDSSQYSGLWILFLLLLQGFHSSVGWRSMIESEREQVSSGLLASSQYSTWPQKP